MTDIVQDGVNAVRRLFLEVFRDSNLEVAEQVLTQDFRFQYPFQGFSPGIEGILEFTKLFHTAFPGFELEINDLFGGPVYSERGPAAGSDVRIGIRWTFRGTHRGEFLGLKPTAKYLSFSAIGIYRGGAQGKLAVGWLEMDTLGLLHHLNAVQPISQILPRLRDK